MLIVSGFFVNFVLQESARLPAGDTVFSPPVMIGIFAALNTLYLARFTYWALQARGRKRARIAVLQGRIAADAILSPSTIAVDPARAPDIQVEPFSMLHVARRRARTTTTTAHLRFRWPTRVLLAVILLLLFTPFVSDWYHRFLQSGQSLDVYLWGMVDSLWSIFDYLWYLSPVLLVLVLLPLVGALVIIALGLVSRIRGVSYRVTASSEGLTEITPRGRRRSVRWEDARLWEVSIIGTQGYLFRLSSPNATVAWTSAIAGPLGVQVDVPLESTMANGREQILLDLVAARTGLRPRTYVTALKIHGAREIERRLRREAITIPLVLALYLIGIAVAVVVVPFVPDLATNSTIAGAYGVAALSTLGLVAYEVVRQRQFARPPRNAHEPYQGPAAPHTFSESASYILSQGKPTSVRIVILVASSLVLAAGIIGYFAFRQALSGFDFFNGSMDHVLWTALLEIALFLGSVVAVVMLVAFGMAGTIYLRADPEQLSVYTGVLNVEAANWEKFERVLIQTQYGRPVTYQAFGARNRLLARWDVERWRPSRGAGSVTPDEFAAIVAQHSGAKVVIEEAQVE